VRSKWQRQVNQAYLAAAPKSDGKCEKCILHKCTRKQPYHKSAGSAMGDKQTYLAVRQSY